MITLKMQHFGPISISDWSNTMTVRKTLADNGLNVSAEFIRNLARNPPAPLEEFVSKHGRHFLIHTKALLCYCMNISSYVGITFKELDA